MCFQVHQTRYTVREWLSMVHVFGGVAPLLFALSMLWLVLNAWDITLELMRWAETGPAVGSLAVLLSALAVVFLALFFGHSCVFGDKIKQEVGGWILSREEWKDFAAELVSAYRARAAACASFVLMLSFSTLTASPDFLAWGTLPLLVLSTVGLLWYQWAAIQISSHLKAGGFFVGECCWKPAKFDGPEFGSDDRGRGAILSPKWRVCDGSCAEKD
jgi:hypothetical protein